MARETKLADVTLRVAEPVTPADVAVMIVVPWPTLLARPPAPTVATVKEEVVHLAELVRYCVLPSLKVPSALNCWVSPNEIEGVPGVTEIDLRIGGVTENPT